MTAHAPLTVCVGVAAADVFAGSSSTVRRALLAAPRRRLGRPVPRRGAPGCSWAALGGPGRRGAAHGRLLGGPGRLRGETERERVAGPMALRRYLECSSHPSNPPKPPVRTPVHPAIHPAHPPLSTTPGSMRMSPRMSSNPYATKSLILSPPAAALAAVTLTGATGQ